MGGQVQDQSAPDLATPASRRASPPSSAQGHRPEAILEKVRPCCLSQRRRTGPGFTPGRDGPACQTGAQRDERRRGAGPTSTVDWPTGFRGTTKGWAIAPMVDAPQIRRAMAPKERPPARPPEPLRAEYRRQMPTLHLLHRSGPTESLNPALAYSVVRQRCVAQPCRRSTEGKRCNWWLRAWPSVAICRERPACSIPSSRAGRKRHSADW